jgi:hypothetical protein
MPKNSKQSSTKSKVKAKSSSKSVKKAVKSKSKTITKPNIAKKKNRDKKKVNLTKLCSTMNKHVFDANDREIIKRIKKLIDSSEEDITKVSLDIIIKEPEKVIISSFQESLQPFIRHYIYMFRRDKMKEKSKAKKK